MDCCPDSNRMKRELAELVAIDDRLAADRLRISHIFLNHNTEYITTSFR